MKLPPKSSPAAGLRCTFFACDGQNRNDLMSAFSWGQPKTSPKRQKKKRKEEEEKQSIDRHQRTKKNYFKFSKPSQKR